MFSVKPVSGSFTTMFVRVTLPVLVTVNVYVITWPTVLTELKSDVLTIEIEGL